MNSVAMISRHTGGVPVVLYNHLDPRDSADKSYPSGWLEPVTRQSPKILEYFVRARNIARHFLYQSFGEASGVHGLYHRFVPLIKGFNSTTNFFVVKISNRCNYVVWSSCYRSSRFPLSRKVRSTCRLASLALTVVLRVIESSLRTMNNLLERLHASFFFYIQTTPDTFLKIGHYLPSVIIVSVAMMFGGLKEWVKAGWRRQEASERTNAKWESRPRPVLEALLLMLATHIFGGFVFLSASKGWLPVRSLGGNSWISEIAFVVCVHLWHANVMTANAPQSLQSACPH